MYFWEVETEVTSLLHQLSMAWVSNRSLRLDNCKLRSKALTQISACPTQYTEECLLTVRRNTDIHKLTLIMTVGLIYA